MLDTHPEAVKIPWVHDNVEAGRSFFYVLGILVRGRGNRASVHQTIASRGHSRTARIRTIMASKNATRTKELA